jgi:hypothetical protein
MLALHPDRANEGVYCIAAAERLAVPETEDDFSVWTQCSSKRHSYHSYIYSCLQTHVYKHIICMFTNMFVVNRIGPFAYVPVYDLRGACPNPQVFFDSPENSLYCRVLVAFYTWVQLNRQRPIAPHGAISASPQPHSTTPLLPLPLLPDSSPLLQPSSSFTSSTTAMPHVKLEHESSSSSSSSTASSSVSSSSSSRTDGPRKKK